MPRATASQIADMDRKLGEVRAALDMAEEAAAKLNSFPDSWLRTPAQDSLLGNLKVLKARHARWEDGTSEQGWYRWAKQRHTPTGQEYPVSFWLRIGDDFLSELTGKKRADGTKDSGLAQSLPAAGTKEVLRETASTSAKDIQQLADKAAGVVTDPWPLKWKLAAGAGVGLIALLLASTLAAQFRPFLNLLPSPKKKEQSQ